MYHEPIVFQSGCYHYVKLTMLHIQIIDDGRLVSDLTVCLLGTFQYLRRKCSKSTNHCEDTAVSRSVSRNNTILHHHNYKLSDNLIHRNLANPNATK